MIAFAGAEPVQVTTVDGKVTEQINTFTYLHCEISCRYNRDAEKINSTSFEITLGKKVHMETLLKLHKVMAIPSFLYGCPSADQLRRTEVVEMQFLGWIVGYTLLDLRKSKKI